MRKVWREADHRRSLTGRLDETGDRIDVHRCQAAKKLVVMFDPFASEALRIPDPLFERILSRHQSVELVFRKYAYSWGHCNFEFSSSQALHKSAQGRSSPARTAWFVPELINIVSDPGEAAAATTQAKGLCSRELV